MKLELPNAISNPISANLKRLGLLSVRVQKEMVFG